MIEDGILKLPLYHGTSTIFLDSILQYGLGGKNPIKEWKVLELAAEVLTHCDSHLKGNEVFDSLEMSFRRMVGQTITSAGFNFQHGDTYLTPAKKTAVKYAFDMKYGSELVSYTILLLEELRREGLKELKNLSSSFPDVFRIARISAAPILIEINDISVTSLLSENGDSPQEYIKEIEDAFRDHPEIALELTQQTNFRLMQPIVGENLRCFLINISRHNGWSAADCGLYKIIKT